MEQVTAYAVGSGHTHFGRLDALSLEDLIVRAGSEAIQDAGIDARDIDAVFLGHFNAGMVSDAFASSLAHQIHADLRFTPAVRCENACASGAAALSAALSAIRAGEVDIALVIGVEKMTHNSTAQVTQALAGAGYQQDTQESALSFPQVFGIAAQQYTERYQSPLGPMAQIAAKNHANALHNPLAQMQRSITFEQCNAVSERNPLIAAPLRLTDCSLVSDGAAAVVLCSAPKAREFATKVALRSLVHVSDFLPMSRRDFLAFEGPQKAISQALLKAGLTLGDLSFAEVHDCFTIAELLIYEAMGLAAPGQGHRALDEGTVFREGRLPVNVSGGLKAKGHPVGATGVSMHALSYRQLTGQAGAMQLPNPEFALVFNMGGAAVANYASILQAV